MESFGTDATNKMSKQSGRSRSQHIMIIVNVVLAVIILVLVAVLISKVHSFNCGNAVSSRELLDSLPLPERFPGFFRTPEEQKALANSVMMRKSVNATSEYLGNNTCAFSCARTQDWIPIAPGEVYHACCFTKSNFTSPNYITDLQGVMRELATYGASRQFFHVEECEQLQGCIECHCEVQEVIYSAVYIDGETYGVTAFKLNGCCKCVNNQI